MVEGRSAEHDQEILDPRIDAIGEQNVVDVKSKGGPDDRGRKENEAPKQPVDVYIEI